MMLICSILMEVTIWNAKFLMKSLSVHIFVFCNCVICCLIEIWIVQIYSLVIFVLKQIKIYLKLKLFNQNWTIT